MRTTRRRGGGGQVCNTPTRLDRSELYRNENTAARSGDYGRNGTDLFDVEAPKSKNNPGTSRATECSRYTVFNPFPVPGIPSVRPSGPSILAGAVGGAPGTARTHPMVHRDRQSKKVGVLCGLDSRIGQIGLRRATAMQWPTSCRSGLPPR